MQRAYDIAASGTRVKRLAFGAGDFTRDIGVAWSRREIESLYARSALVIACRAAGLEPPPRHRVGRPARPARPCP